MIQLPEDGGVTVASQMAKKRQREQASQSGRNKSWMTDISNCAKIRV